MNALALIAKTAAQRGSWWPDDPVGRCWVVFGFMAQAVFAGRFLVQWIASERRGRSHMPVVFWYMSLLGGAMLFSYAVFWKRDIPVALGQTTGIIVYTRNLMLLRREKLEARTR